MIGYHQWRSDKDRAERNYTYERWAWEAAEADKKAQEEKVKNPTPKPARVKCTKCSTDFIEALNSICECMLPQQLSDLIEVDTP